MTHPASFTPAQRALFAMVEAGQAEAAEWLRNGREPYGPASEWNVMRVSCEGRSVFLSREEWLEARQFLDLAPPKDRTRMYVMRAAPQCLS